FVEAAAKRSDPWGQGRRRIAKETDYRYRLLLRSGGIRPSQRRAQADEKVAACGHSMTSSARASSDCGNVRPSAFAVFRLMTSSNLVGCWIGRSAGLAPASIRPA